MENKLCSVNKEMIVIVLLENISMIIMLFNYTFGVMYYLLLFKMKIGVFFLSSCHME